MGVERIGRNGDDLLFAAVGVQGLALGVGGHEKFVVNAFGGDKHEREIERAFLGNDVFFGDGVGMAFHRRGQGAPCFVAFGADAAVGVERKFGIDGHQFFVAEKNDRVCSFAAG